MEPHLRHPKLVIKLIVMPCDKRKPGNTKIRVQIARNVSKNGVKTKRAALLHRDLSPRPGWPFAPFSSRDSPTLLELTSGVSPFQKRRKDGDVGDG